MWDLAIAVTCSRHFSTTWKDYCNETIEALLDIESGYGTHECFLVELSCIENKLLFSYDNSVDRKLEAFNATMSMNTVVKRMKKGEYSHEMENK